MTRKQLRELTPHQFFLMVGSNQDLRIEISDNMKKYGGSFVQKIGEALLLADMSPDANNNGYKLAEAFSDYFYKYATFGEQE